MEKLQVKKRSLSNLTNNNKNSRNISKKQKKLKNRQKNTKNNVKYQNFMQIFKKYALQICICFLLFALLLVLAFLSFDGNYFVFLNRPKLFQHPQKIILLFALNFVAVLIYYLYSVWAKMTANLNGQKLIVPLANKNDILPATNGQLKNIAKVFGFGISRKILHKLINNYFLYTVLLFSLFACYFLFFNIHFLALCVVSIFMGCFVCLNQLFQKQNITSKIILIVTLLLFICNFLCNYLLFMLN